MAALPIEIILEHPDFVAVNKPAGLSVQDEKDTVGILPILCEQLNIEKLWLVHRLDKVTSGVLLLAKSSQAASTLSKLFALREMEKFYLAISAKKPSKKQGTIAGDMQKSRDGQWMLKKSLINPAVSQFFSSGLGDGLRLFLLKPLTGKTHQLRVALKSLGSPIVGDKLYKGIEADRTYLHAMWLGFEFDGERFELQCLPSQGELFAQDSVKETLQAFADPKAQSWPKVSNDLMNKITKQGKHQDELL